MSVLVLCKFTPLGFETCNYHAIALPYALCKFTPLGFETLWALRAKRRTNCVNLPRWGLKLFSTRRSAGFCDSVNLPRWGLKPSLLGRFFDYPIRV